VTQNHKAIEQPERYRRQHEEVDCRNAIDMIALSGLSPEVRARDKPTVSPSGRSFATSSARQGLG
jgi:hypothetical protein